MVSLRNFGLFSYLILFPAKIFFKAPKKILLWSNKIFNLCKTSILCVDLPEFSPYFFLAGRQLFHKTSNKTYRKGIFNPLLLGNNIYMFKVTAILKKNVQYVFKMLEPRPKPWWWWEGWIPLLWGKARIAQDGKRRPHCGLEEAYKKNESALFGRAMVLKRWLI